MDASQFYELGEYRVEMCCDDDEISRLFHEYLREFAVSDPSTAGPADRYTIRSVGGLVQMWFNANEVTPAVPLPAAVDKIMREISSAAIRRFTVHLGVHAGAVSRNGVGVVLPAPSRSGKSTLTAALVQAGFQYMTDEAAVIDLVSGHLRPFARPLCLDPRSLQALAPLSCDLPVALDWPPESERQIAPRQLGSVPARAGAPLQVILLPRFDPNGPTTCEPIPRSEALIALIRNAFNFARFSDGMEQLAHIVRLCSPYRLVFDDVDRAVEHVLDLVDHIS